MNDAVEEISIPEKSLQSKDSQSVAQLRSRRALIHHVALPFLLLVVALFGGIRFSGVDGSIVFLRPALICLVFAAGLVVLFLRAGLISLDGWISERFSLIQNISNGITLATLFFAAVQLFNSILPEQGLPFWIVSFCVFWTLWTNLFAELDGRKLLRSLTAMFVLSFAVKYLLLSNLAKPGNEGWISSIVNNPTQAAATWLLDLPQFAAGTGYLQFFTLALFVIALYFIPRAIED
jgi:hypothetical protein